MNQIFFSGWTGLARTLVIGILAHILLVLFLRLTGRRTLSKMNAFDLVVTVALGSTLATISVVRRGDEAGASRLVGVKGTENAGAADSRPPAA